MDNIINSSLSIENENHQGIPQNDDFTRYDETMDDLDIELYIEAITSASTTKQYHLQHQQNEFLDTSFSPEQESAAFIPNPAMEAINTAYDYNYQDPDPPIVTRNNEFKTTSNIMEALMSWCKVYGLRPPTFNSKRNQPARVVGKSSRGDVQNMDWERFTPGSRDNFRRFWDMHQLSMGRKSFSEHVSDEMDKGPYRFSKTFCQAKSKIDHYQMRNLLATTSQRDAFYANKWQIMHVDTFDPIGSSEPPSIAMDLIQESSSDIRWRISTLAKSVDESVLFAGTLRGNIAYKSFQNSDSILVREYVGSDKAVNYIDPTPHNPHAFLAINDGMLATLDYSQNLLISQQFLHFDKTNDKFRNYSSAKMNADIPMAVNCSATSPDGRLRLLVGDFPHMILADARSGNTNLIETISMCCCGCSKCSSSGTLSCRTANICTYHSRFPSFAIAWSQFDSFSVATGSEDGTVRLWDARMWRTVSSWQGSSSIGSIHFASSETGGSNNPILFAAEASDMVHVIDTAQQEPIQNLSFLGDIGGLSVRDNGTVMVLNSDRDFGGLMIWQPTNSQKQGEDNEKLTYGPEIRREWGDILSVPNIKSKALESDTEFGGARRFALNLARDLSFC